MATSYQQCGWHCFSLEHHPISDMAQRTCNTSWRQCGLYADSFTSAHEERTRHSCPKGSSSSSPSQCHWSTWGTRPCTSQAAIDAEASDCTSSSSTASACIASNSPRRRRPRRMHFQGETRSSRSRGATRCPASYSPRQRQSRHIDRPAPCLEDSSSSCASLAQERGRLRMAMRPLWQMPHHVSEQLQVVWCSPTTCDHLDSKTQARRSNPLETPCRAPSSHSSATSSRGPRSSSSDHMRVETGAKCELPAGTSRRGSSSGCSRTSSGSISYAWKPRQGSQQVTTNTPWLPTQTVRRLRRQVRRVSSGSQRDLMLIWRSTWRLLPLRFGHALSLSLMDPQSLQRNVVQHGARSRSCHASLQVERLCSDSMILSVPLSDLLCLLCQLLYSRIVMSHILISGDEWQWLGENSWFMIHLILGQIKRMRDLVPCAHDHQLVRVRHYTMAWSSTRVYACPWCLLHGPLSLHSVSCMRLFSLILITPLSFHRRPPSEHRLPSRYATGIPLHASAAHGCPLSAC